MIVMDPFEILGVTSETSIADVKKAYFNLAKFCHPLYGGSTHDMCMVQAAFDHVMGLRAFDQAHKFTKVPSYFTVICNAFDISESNVLVYGSAIRPIVESEVLSHVKANDNTTHDMIVAHIESLKNKVIVDQKPYCFDEMDNVHSQYDMAYQAPLVMDAPIAKGRYTSEPPYWAES